MTLRASGRAAAADVVLVLLLLAVVAAPSTAAPPVLPDNVWSALLVGLDAPALAPGGSGTVSGSVDNPLAGPMTAVVLDLEYYAFNAFPGNATGPIPGDAGVALSTSNASGLAVSLSLPPLATGAGESFSVTTVAGSAAPDGTYALRFALTFLENGTSYRLESRGYFSAEEWANATSGPGNTSTLNASRLGVSGVVPETATLVRSTSYFWPLYALLAGAIVLAGVGAYVAWRRGPGSKSGVDGPAEPQSAPSAFGNNRKRDGD